MFPQKDRSSSAKTSPSRLIVVRGLLNEKNGANVRSAAQPTNKGEFANRDERGPTIVPHPHSSPLLSPHPICVTDESLESLARDNGREFDEMG
jgi:hypothetical protein